MFLLLLVKERMEYYLCTTPPSEMFARPDLDVCLHVTRTLIWEGWKLLSYFQTHTQLNH